MPWVASTKSIAGQEGPNFATVKGTEGSGAGRLHSQALSMQTAVQCAINDLKNH